MLQPLHPWGKNPPPPQFPFNKRLGGPQNQSEYFGEEKNLLYLLGIEFQLDHLACSLVVTCKLTKLTQLLVWSYISI